MVRTHTLQGTFGDPYYGGNANFVGWDLIGYPGIRLNVTSEDQRLGAQADADAQVRLRHRDVHEGASQVRAF